MSSKLEKQFFAQKYNEGKVEGSIFLLLAPMENLLLLQIAGGKLC
jgi:hypothetical protein